MTINIDYINQLRKIISEHKHCWGTIIKQGKKYRHLFEYIIKYTEKYPDLPFRTKAYWTLNQITEIPKCSVCGQPFPINKVCDPLTGYNSTACSNSCAQKSPEKQQRQQEQNMRLYGVKYTTQRPEIRSKISKSKQAHTPAKKKEIQNKRIQTCMQRYNVSNVSQVKEIAKKMGESQQNRTPEQKHQTKIQRRQTKLQKYNNAYYNNAAQISKTKLSFSPEKKRDILQRTETTNLQKYGVKHPWNSQKSKDNKAKTIEIKYYQNFILTSTTIEPLFTLEEFLKNGRRHVYKWKCKKCQSIFEAEVGEKQLWIARCEKCYPINAQYSTDEKELLNFILKYVPEQLVEQNTRKIIKPKELDIYIPSKKLAFEYDGLYWHSERTSDPLNYQLLKTEMCCKLGIQLIHVFENEWVTKQDIVKSRILNFLGIYEHVVFARKCIIKEVDPTTSRVFQDVNHLQGATNAKIHIGLFFANELISLMTFGPSRYNKKYEWELIRFCNKQGFHIPGAAGKLLAYFERVYLPKTLISYADRRWSNGNVYVKLGFNLDHISKPNYWYWNHSQGSYVLESRLKYQKYKLASCLKTYDANLTEAQNMANNGYLRIFDCGNLVYIKKYS